MMSARIRYASGATHFEIHATHHERAHEALEAAIPDEDWRESEDGIISLPLDYYPRAQMILVAYYDQVTREFVGTDGTVEEIEL